MPSIKSPQNHSHFTHDILCSNFIVSRLFWCNAHSLITPYGPEMKQSKKGNQWYFGMKVHIGTDTQDCVHSVAVTDAATHDSAVMEELLHGEETTIYGDKAYASQEKKETAEASGVTWRVSRKAKRGKKLNCADRAFNRKSNRTHTKVEHAFGVVKNLWGYRRVRYKGIAKNAAQVFTLFALSNLYMARKKLAVL